MNPGSDSPRPVAAGRAARPVALEILQQVLVHGRSLATAMSEADKLDSRERALVMELVQGVLRWRWKLECILDTLLKKPLKAKHRSLQILIMLALYELTELSTPDYAVVDEAVRLSRRGGRSWASGLVNAVLRACIRDRESCLAALQGNEEALYSHPGWLIQALAHDWPHQWRAILEANNQRPPFWLRVNRRYQDTDRYLDGLQQAGVNASRHEFCQQALKLEHGMDVTRLPGFEQGSVSVQDVGAQLAAELLAVAPGQRVLDLCAAPGGKTCHVLETQSELKTMVAVELEPQRMRRVEQNLQRLKLEAETVVADASVNASWWDGQWFDRILVDAPCSATGVIRRHPDIKSLRREQDLQSLTGLQRQILHQAWQMLSPGGELLYVTCSVLKCENEQQVAGLLADHDDASELPIEAHWGHACKHGRQLLPGEADADGFYFARLRKTSA